MNHPSSRPAAWADFCEQWVRCPTCGTASPPLGTPDACMDWADSHHCPPVTAEQAAVNAAVLDTAAATYQRDHDNPAAA